MAATESKAANAEAVTALLNEVKNLLEVIGSSGLAHLRKLFTKATQSANSDLAHKHYDAIREYLEKHSLWAPLTTVAAGATLLLLLASGIPGLVMYWLRWVSMLVSVGPVLALVGLFVYVHSVANGEPMAMIGTAGAVSTKFTKRVGAIFVNKLLDSSA